MGIWTSEHPVDLVLRFTPSVARRVGETIWHRSQQLADLPDGGVEMRLTVAAPIEVRPWILGWGSVCEVLAPESFGAELAFEAEVMAARSRSEPPGALPQPVESRPSRLGTGQMGLSPPRGAA